MAEEIIQISIIAVTLTILIISAIFDKKTMRIPNWLTFGGMGAGLLITYIMSWQTGLISTGVIILLFFLGMTGFVGLGDLKLLMALVALQGWQPALITLGVASIGLVIIKVKNEHYAVNMKRLKDKELAAEGIKVPFAPYLLAGYIMYLMYFVVDKFI